MSLCAASINTQSIVWRTSLGRSEKSRTLLFLILGFQKVGSEQGKVKVNLSNPGEGDLGHISGSSSLGLAESDWDERHYRANAGGWHGFTLSGCKNKQQLSCCWEWAVMSQSGLAWPALEERRGRWLERWIRTQSYCSSRGSSHLQAS